MDALARRLNRFLIKTPLLHRLVHVRKWGGSGGYSYHSPIFLEIEDANFKPGSPFKFNASWLNEEYFLVIVRENWIHCNLGSGPPPAVVISNNLSYLKEKTIRWEKAKEKREGEELNKIERELK